MSEQTMWRADVTIGEKYGPAMEITGQAEADAYFERCVAHMMHCRRGVTREEAERVERVNLGYFAGYYDNETRRRVERLFRCEHPYFGRIDVNGPPSPETAFNLGAATGQAARGGGR